MSAWVTVSFNPRATPFRFRVPLSGRSVTVKTIWAAPLSASLAARTALPMVTVPPSATVAPLLTAVRGLSLTGAMVMANGVAAMPPPAPSATVTLNTSVTVSEPSCR